MNLFVGYDEKFREAFDVCCWSVTHEQKSSVQISALNKEHIINSFGYDRNFGEPQSTEFTFTRFLVPLLSNYEGWSIFCDCDFLFLRDPAELIQIAKQEPDKAVHVVKHPQYSVHSEVKMNGLPQHNAYRKNWASLMVFNNAHPSNKKLTMDYINTHPRGKDFHEFKWLSDFEIGSLPMEWNCLDGYYHLERPAAIHYTDGGPWQGYTNTRYAHYWQEAYKRRNIFMGRN